VAAREAHKWPPVGANTKGRPTAEPRRQSGSTWLPLGPAWLLPVAPISIQFAAVPQEAIQLSLPEGGGSGGGGNFSSNSLPAARTRNEVSKEERPRANRQQLARGRDN